LPADRSVYWSQEITACCFDPEGVYRQTRRFIQRVHLEDRDRGARKLFLNSRKAPLDVVFRIVLPARELSIFARQASVRNMSGALVEYSVRDGRHRTQARGRRAGEIASGAGGPRTRQQGDHHGRAGSLRARVISVDRAQASADTVALACAQQSGESARGCQLSHGGHPADVCEVRLRLTQSLPLFVRALAFGDVHRRTTYSTRAPDMCERMPCRANILKFSRWKDYSEDHVKVGAFLWLFKKSFSAHPISISR